MSLLHALRKPIITRVNDPSSQNRSGGQASLMDLIGPAHMEESAHAIQCGDSWMVLLECVGLPLQVSMAWMSFLTDLDRVHTYVWWVYEPVSDAEAQHILEASETAARETLIGDSSSSQAVDVRAEQGLADVANLRHAIAIGAERLVRVALMVAVTEASRDDAIARARQIQRAASTTGLHLQPMTFRQASAYAALVAGLPDLDHADAPLVSDVTGSVATTLLPVSMAPIRQATQRPIVWGFHLRTGEPVIWDRYQAVNPHALVIASSGSGKTYTVRGLIAQEWALGDPSHGLILIDPKFREYAELVGSLGGSYISFDTSGATAINPLDLPALHGERADQMPLEQLVIQQTAIVRALITQEWQESGLTIRPSDVMTVEQSILEAYHETLPHGHVPTLSDVQRIIARHAPVLADQMRVLTEGALGRLINRPSSLRDKDRLVGIDLSTLLSVDDPIMTRVLPSVVCVWAMMRGLSFARSHVVLDEAHILLRNPTGLRVVERMIRVGRSLGMQVTLISQSMIDFSEGLAQVLNENTATKLILGVGANAAQMIVTALNLPQGTDAYLSRCRLIPEFGSTGLLVTEQVMTPIVVRPWPDLIHRLSVGQRLPDEWKDGRR
jgi:hypothetical protein